MLAVEIRDKAGSITGRPCDWHEGFFWGFDNMPSTPNGKAIFMHGYTAGKKIHAWIVETGIKHHFIPGCL